MDIFLTLTLASAIMFITYYLTKVAQKPKVVAKDGQFKNFLLKNCDILQERFWPTLWCLGTHFHTVLASFVRSFARDVQYRREILPMSDGGQVALDWFNDTPRGQHVTKPVALFITGITGDSRAEYIKTLVPEAARLGFTCLVFNYRGRGGIELKTPRTYCAVNTEDLSEVLHHVKKLFPSCPVFATGISLGGLILGQYLVQYGEKALVKAAMLISTVYDAHRTTENIEKKGLNLMMNEHIAKGLRDLVMPNKELFSKKFDVDAVLNTRTIRQFDEVLISKMFGFSGAHEYYDKGTLKGKISSVRVPTLCLTAADDIFVPLDSLPIEEVENSDYLALVITSKGGHIGFMNKLIPSPPFFSERLYGQYIMALASVCHNGEFSLQLNR